MRFFLRVFIILLFFSSCISNDKAAIDVSKIDVKYRIDRFDIDFYTTTEKTLPLIKEKYKPFFPSNVADSVWISKIKDKDEQELFSETQKIYNDISPIDKQLKALFKHVKYYNPKLKVPNVVTMLTNIDYQNRITYVDSLLIISLDVFLGKNHEFYADYPQYIKENNTKEHLIVDAANAIINQQIYYEGDRTFLGKMLSEGKKQYLLDLYLPQISEKEKTGFTKEKLDWAILNEEFIWMYFIENKLLYSTDTTLSKRFLENAPFSKFYLEVDNLSPGKIGSWIGWKIVASYMKHNDVSLQELIKLDPESLLNKSKYKPRK